MSLRNRCPIDVRIAQFAQSSPQHCILWRGTCGVGVDNLLRLFAGYRHYLSVARYVGYLQVEGDAALLRAFEVAWSAQLEVCLSDAEAVEVFLADDNVRQDFYTLLCAFGRALHLVLNAEQAYNALSKEERQKYQDTFIFFSKVRRSVKLQYCDAIDNAEYEPLMQNLLDTHLSVAGLKKITSPIDILNKDDFEKELEELGSLRSKADAIASRMTRSISEKRDENPAYYDSFSKRIRDALALYKEKVISEAEYLAKMRTIMGDYHAGRSTVSYPERIKNNVHAQAFFGVLTALFDEVEDERITPDFVAEVSEEITKIVASHSQVDWTNNKTIHDRISQDIDDLFYKYEKEHGLKLSFDLIDKIIDNVKTVALRRF